MLQKFCMPQSKFYPRFLNSASLKILPPLPKFFLSLCVYYNIVSQCLKFMLEIEEDPEWLTADNLEDEDDSSR